MPNGFVRGLDESTLDRLKECARAHGRSLGAEQRMILKQASRQADPGTARSRAGQMTRRPADRPHTEGTDLPREDRSR